MTDPTLGAANALCVGICAVLIAELGLPPGLLALGFLAATIGLLGAPPGRAWWHDMAIFVSVAVCSAWLGMAFGPVLVARVPQLAHPDKVAVIVFGTLFHPIYNHLVARLRRGQPASGAASATPGADGGGPAP